MMEWWRWKNRNDDAADADAVGGGGDDVDGDDVADEGQREGDGMIDRWRKK